MLRIRPNATLVSSLFTVWEICWGLFTKSGWALLTWKKDGGQIAPNNLPSSVFWTSWCRICEMWWDIMSSHRWHLSQSCPLNVGLRQSLGNTSQKIQRHGVQASQERLSMTYHCSLWATEFRDVLPSYFVVAYVFKPISLAVLCRGQCFSVICCSIWAPFPWRHSFSSLSPSLPTFPFLPIQYFLLCLSHSFLSLTLSLRVTLPPAAADLQIRQKKVAPCTTHPLFEKDRHRQ